MTKVTKRPGKTPGAGARGPDGSRRQRQKQDKLERIRDAAWELFTTKGYAATTTKQVAARAKVATGTLFLYASDKRDLLFMVFHERLSNAVERGFASLPSGAPLLDQLVHLFGGFFHTYEAHPDVARDFVRALPGGDGPNARALNGMTLGFLYQLAGLVGEAQARGEVSRAVEPLQAASNFFALYFGALMSWLSEFASLEAALDPLLKRSLALQIRGLLPRPDDAKEA